MESEKCAAWRRHFQSGRATRLPNQLPQGGKQGVPAASVSPPRLHGYPRVTAPRGTCAHRVLPNLGSQATPAGPLPPVSFPWEPLPKAKAPLSQGPKSVWERPSWAYMPPPEVFLESHLHAMRTQRLIRGLPSACLGQQSSRLLSPPCKLTTSQDQGDLSDTGSRSWASHRHRHARGGH